MMKRVICAVLSLVIILCIATSLADSNRENAFEKVKISSMNVLKEIQRLYDIYGENLPDEIVRMAYAYLVLYTGSAMVVQAEQVDSAVTMFPTVADIYKLGYVGDNMFKINMNITNEATEAWNKFLSEGINKSEAIEVIMKAVKDHIDLYDIRQNKQDEKGD